MSVVVFDAGNSIIKAKIARRENGEIAFSHASRQLTGSYYQQILRRSATNENANDYLKVNGMPYVIDEALLSCVSLYSGFPGMGIPPAGMILSMSATF